MTIHGVKFPLDEARVPEVRIGTAPARVVRASSTALDVLVPEGLEGGSTPVRVADAPGETALLEVGVRVATGLHQVDSPAFDAAGNLYLTYSGHRGQDVPVSVFRVGREREKQPLGPAVPNATSVALDAQGRLHVSSRFEGSVYRLTDVHAELVASDLGSPCGMAFGRDGTLYVGDRSGSVLQVTTGREVTVLATLPPSVAAYHLALGPDEALYVSGPTLSSRDRVHRIDLNGQVDVLPAEFGRPQGLAFDQHGYLYVIEALAGDTGLYRMRVDGTGAPELVLSGVGLVGVAFDPTGGLVVTSNDTAYRFEVPLRPFRSFQV